MADYRVLGVTRREFLQRSGMGFGALAAAVLALELTGHSPNGTFLSIVAAPGLATLGIHSAAKNLN